MKTFPSTFIAIDLDIKSRLNPDILVQAWEGRVSAHSVDWSGRRHWLRVALISQPKDRAEAIRRYSRLVARLPARGRAIWKQAVKELDIGIQAGYEQCTGEWMLEPRVVQMVADLGARLRFTVYSPMQIHNENAP